jgi:hypothetical protein
MRSGSLARLLLAFAIVAMTLAVAQSPVTARGATTRDAPIAPGESGQIGDYVISVVDVFPDATDEVMQASDQNALPADGNQFFMVRVSVSYEGSIEADPGFDLSFNAVGASNVGYNSLYALCGIIPDGVPDDAEGFADGEVEFNVCWLIPASDAETLMMYIENHFDMSDELLYFSLGLGAAAGMGTPVPALRDVEVVDGHDRNAPVPAGETGRLGDFHLQVSDVLPQADAYLEGNGIFGFVPPTAGNQYVMVVVTITNAGSEPVVPWSTIRFLGIGETEYTEAENSCGVVPDSVYEIPHLFPGGTVTFNVCWQVASDDVDALAMAVEPWVSDDPEGARVWFALTD